MSITEAEAWEEEAYERMVEDILQDRRDEIIDEFVCERTASYYREHRGLLNPAVAALDEARKLKGVSPSACLVFAHATIEIALRDAMLKPMFFGIVHDDNIGILVADMAVKNTQFRKVLFEIMKDYRTDLREIKRNNSSASIWKEMAHIREMRNKVLHRGEMASEKDAFLALEISEFIVETVFPSLQDRFISLPVRQAQFPL
jgi:hypothetical protein